MQVSNRFSFPYRFMVPRPEAGASQSEQPPQSGADELESIRVLPARPSPRSNASSRTATPTSLKAGVTARWVGGWGGGFEGAGWWVWEGGGGVAAGGRWWRRTCGGTWRLCCEYARAPSTSSGPPVASPSRPHHVPITFPWRPHHVPITSPSRSHHIPSPPAADVDATHTRTATPPAAAARRPSG